LGVAVKNLNLVQLAAAREEVGLYNLAEDPGESVNLADQHPEKVKELRRRMERFDSELRANSRPAGKWAE
jgi:hypothetical protein